ncbi:nuclear transport factor 2 family protein [Nocardia sp. BSTN01]|uniref:nuclear transport factor 2 family protein n=1 Tax=Nocardia sp. BSTN01 TaxID=2783665 RepID=UPI00188F3312|nr:nuclear transport factor 2 family protein [Nocardia sp. BSTN01]MBF4999665.1 nuclear transport factor 2 family protein [Nocardia sp. BSTN01]
MLAPDDHLAIHRLVALYGHVIDERQFSRVGEIFTADAEYDVRNRGAGYHRGIAAIRELWTATGNRHPLAHHGTNVLIEERSDGGVDVLSKGVCVHPDGTVHSTTYRQVAVRTADGWRLSSLVAELRTTSGIPAVS